MESHVSVPVVHTEAGELQNGFFLQKMILLFILFLIYIMILFAINKKMNISKEYDSH